MTFADLDTPLLVAGSVQVIMLILGLWLLARMWGTAAGKAARRRSCSLSAWEVSLPDFLFAAFAVIAASVAGELVARAMVSYIDFGEEVADIVHGAGFQGGMLAGAWMGRIWIKQNGIAATGPSPSPPPPAGNVWLAAVITLLAAFPLLTGINLLWTVFLAEWGWDGPPQQLIEIFATTDSPAIILSMSFLAVVIAPLTEEIIFRAGLFRYLRTRIPRWAAYVLPAAIFGLLHGNVVAFAPLFALGIVFSIAYERTGRIAVPIIAHSLFNLNTVMLLLAGMEV